MPQQSGDNEAWDSPPPPPTARTWMHPSEVGRMQAALTAPPPPRRFSVSTALVAGSFGAVAMFVLLAAAGMLDSKQQLIMSNTTVPEASAALVEDSAPIDLAAVEQWTALGMVTSAGIPLAGSSGLIATIAAQRPIEDGLSVTARGDRYDTVTLVGYDPESQVAVLSVHGLELDAAPVDGARTTDKTTLISVSSDGEPRGATVKDITASLHNAESSLFGLVAIDTLSKPNSADALISGDPAAVVGLIQPADDNVQDTHFYATSALVVERVSRQILRNEPVSAGHLAMPMEGDERVLQVDDRPVTDADDMASCLMAYSPGDHVSVMVEANGTTRTVEATLTEAAVPETTNLHSDAP